MATAAQPKAIPTIAQSLPVFQEMLPPAFIRAAAEMASAPNRVYERLFSPVILLWCLVFQRLNADHSCDAVLGYVGSGAIDHLDERHQEPVSQRLGSESTSAFCQIRQKVSLTFLTAVLHQTAQYIRQTAGENAVWHRHPVVLLDGSTLTLYPSEDLVKHYGQHANQHGPTYWVSARITAAFCLLTGALHSVAEGSLHLSEQVLARTVLADLPAGSVCVGDQNFGVFSVAQVARHHALYVLLRLTTARAQTLIPCSLRSGLDVPITWTASRQDQCVPTLAPEPIVGRLIYVHLQRDGFRPVDLSLFTTLVDATRYPLDDLLWLYGQRWHVEVNLRYVKDTLDMGRLHVKSPETLRVELWAGLIAYNLIRAWMSHAAQRAGLTPLALCFSQCWRRVGETLTHLCPTSPCQDIYRELERLLDRLAACRLPERPRWRVEPRAVRKRRLAYPPLKGSRAAARQRTLEDLQKPVKS